MARYESFAPAELGRMFLMLHRSSKRLRTIEEVDTERLVKMGKKYHDSLEITMGKDQYTLCNGMLHKDDDYQYSERRQVKYALRKLKESARDRRRPSGRSLAR